MPVPDVFSLFHDAKQEKYIGHGHGHGRDFERLPGPFHGLLPAGARCLPLVYAGETRYLHLMPRRAIPAFVLVPLLIVALVVSTSACGTIANFGGLPIQRMPVAYDKEGRILNDYVETAPAPVAYGGLKFDIERVFKSDMSIDEKALISPLWVVDLAMSATLDTATLPIVFWMNLRLAWERGVEEQDGPKRVKVLEIQPVPDRD
jgi:hypothetical protein